MFEKCQHAEQRVFFRHTALIFLAIHKALLRQIALPDEKILRCWAYFQFSNKAQRVLASDAGPAQPASATSWPEPSVPAAVRRSTVYQAAVLLWSPKFSYTWLETLPSSLVWAAEVRFWLSCALLFS